ncbi:hypothetical protein [Eoetvoesiella caeni]|uniref:Uncharacterized protein n=1 Tax=Eoetvoesiella caeni TaxID=645616 RepID=A0A366HCS3_9BURK|nr:hypothetical protein [Eoetvoesiella caeni]MCI2808930.1 hypothetical protein [Eoetvoesiella caeni]NYT55569.1 hypothetical protein [Eoetvoesiella caeni]RBP40124.1 hypothetical protein DFR37_104221 [Eoetvoesiella caeni]
MTTYIPTIHELKRQSESELRAMFRRVACVAASTQCPVCQQAAARKTLENIQRSLASQAPRP